MLTDVSWLKFYIFMARSNMLLIQCYRANDWKPFYHAKNGYLYFAE